MPRFTRLSFEISDYIVIPLRPSLIDLRRTLRMLRTIEDHVNILVEQRLKPRGFLKNNVFAVFNLVPAWSERSFIEYILHNKEVQGSTTIRVAKRMQHDAEKLISMISFLKKYIKSKTCFERFPHDEVENAVAEAKGFLEELIERLGGLNVSARA